MKKLFEIEKIETDSSCPRLREADVIKLSKGSRDYIGYFQKNIERSNESCKFVVDNNLIDGCVFSKKELLALADELSNFEKELATKSEQMSQKFWKIKHISTGLFFKPTSYSNRGNLSKNGKAYYKKQFFTNQRRLVYMNVTK